MAGSDCKIDNPSFLECGTLLGWPAVIAVVGWEIHQPQQNETFSTTSNLAGNGTSQALIVNYTAKVTASGITLQSRSGSTSPIGDWALNLNAPSGGWAIGTAKFVILEGTAEQASKDITFQDIGGGPV